MPKALAPVQVGLCVFDDQ